MIRVVTWREHGFLWTVALPPETSDHECYLALQARWQDYCRDSRTWTGEDLHLHNVHIVDMDYGSLYCDGNCIT